MPSTRSGGGASPESGEEGGTAQLLEEAAAELSSEIAARKAAEERLAELEAQFADYSAEDRAFATPGPASDPEEESDLTEEFIKFVKNIRAMYGAGLSHKPRCV